MSNKALSVDVNSLFARLEDLRIAHLNSTSGQTQEAIDALTAPFDTTPVEQGTVFTNEPHTLLKSYLNLLRNSTYLTDITVDDINAINIPQPGTLIKALELNVGEALIDRIEQIPTSFASEFNASATTVHGTNFSNFRASATVNGTFFSGFFTASSVFGTFFSDFRSASSVNGSNFSTFFTYEACQNSWRNASFNFGTNFSNFRSSSFTTSNGSFWEQTFFTTGGTFSR